MTPMQQVLSALEQHGCKPRQNGGNWQANCPAHEDRSPSLSVKEADDGRVLVKCFAGCETPKVCAALGLTMAQLMPPKSDGPNASKGNGRASSGRIVATYEYRDEAGKLLHEVLRMEGKKFSQRRPVEGGGWARNLDGVRSVLYQTPKLLVEPDRRVIIVEGEKDANNLTKLGFLATCNAGGAGKWKPEHSQQLRGRHVVILPDNDDVGQRHAEQVAVALQGIAASVRVLMLPDLPHKGDVSDWLAGGGTTEALKALAAAAPLWTPYPWPEIDSFDRLRLPAFPTHVLPKVLRDWVSAISHFSQTPDELAGLLCLAVCSAMLARRVRVNPRGDWFEPVNLFVAVLLGPGNRKTAVYGGALQPLEELEQELIEAARPTIAILESERREAEARLLKLEKTASKSEEERLEARDLAARLATERVPVLPKLLTADATNEKLEMMIADQDGRIASMSPEGGVIDVIAGRYSNGVPNINVYLQGHAGDPLCIDRVSRDSIRVKDPALTCAFTIQPTVIENLSGKSIFRGRGLWGRFLWAYPQSLMGYREVGASAVPNEVQERYRQNIRDLAKLAESEWTLRLTPEANQGLQRWEREIEIMLRDGRELEMIADWGGKLAGATLRIAAIMHCIEHGRAERIGIVTLEAAIVIARYLIPHAEAVLSMGELAKGRPDSDAQYILRWIEDEGHQLFSKRDAQQHGRRRFLKAHGIDAPLDELVRRGYIRPRPAEAIRPGRPASPTYEVNPSFSKRSVERCTQYPQNSTTTSSHVNCEDIEDTTERGEDPDIERETI